jgi:hypothetical protein
MNSRQKFNSTMERRIGFKIPKTEFSYWAGCFRRWPMEGLGGETPIPDSALNGDVVRGSVRFGHGDPFLERLFTHELVDNSVRPLLELDSYLAKFPFDLSPGLEKKMIEETEHHKIFKDSYGLLIKQIKGNAATHHTIEYPIKTKNDFEGYKDLYHIDDVLLRIPAPIEKIEAGLKDRSYPIRLGGNPYGFTFFPRMLMGEIGYLTALYDTPDLIHDINRFYLDFVKNYWGRILDEIEIDCVFILEDIAYRNGSMISPDQFREFALPYTEEFVHFVKEKGVKQVFVDCDGLITELIPLWIEAGVTGIFPIEAVNDIVAIRKQYPSLNLLGGVDKLPLISGGMEEINRELSRIRPLLAEGGYIPHVDHLVPEDVSWHNFQYYRLRLNEIIDSL